MAKSRENDSPVTMSPIVPIVGFIALALCTVFFVLSLVLKWHIAISAVIGGFVLLTLRMALTVNERITRLFVKSEYILSPFLREKRRNGIEM